MTDIMEPGGMIDNMPVNEIAGRRITPVIFMIDVSGSMSGSKIRTVNSAMQDIVNDLSNFSNSDSEIRYAVMSFTDSCKWETGEQGLIQCDGLWQDLSTYGGTSFNQACLVLKDRMSGKKENGLFKFASGKTITPPVVILLTDGYPTDGDANGMTGISELRKNKYFQGSYKVAIAIGDDANLILCRNFTEDEELVYTVYSSKVLEAVLKAVVKNSVSVSSSGASDISTVKNPNEFSVNTEQLAGAIKNEIPDTFSTEIKDWD
ncbi:MAG: VWA domain-containing protein [Ruminococcus sp.]|nr:VWA domain-containing protein [Ruminococcus sp.]